MGCPGFSPVERIQVEDPVGLALAPCLDSILNIDSQIAGIGQIALLPERFFDGADVIPT